MHSALLSCVLSCAQLSSVLILSTLLPLLFERLVCKQSKNMISKVLFWGNVLQVLQSTYKCTGPLTVLLGSMYRTSVFFIQAAENLSIQHCLSVD